MQQLGYHAKIGAKINVLKVIFASNICVLLILPLS